MASTITTFALSGSVKFPVNFEYLARRFVVVTLIGLTRTELKLNVDYRFTSKMEIETTEQYGPSQGYTTIEIRRVTSATDRLVNFTDGSILRSYDLNIAQIQSLHIVEEVRDSEFFMLSENADGNLDARNRRIVNVGAPVAATDAVRLQDLNSITDRSLLFPVGDTGQVLPPVADRANKIVSTNSQGKFSFRAIEISSQSELLAYLAGGNGASAIGSADGRDVQKYLDAGSKFAYETSTGSVNVRALGVKGDGTDEAVALQAALDTGFHLFFPMGEYVSSVILYPKDSQWLFGESYGAYGGRSSTIRSMFPNTPLFASNRTNWNQSVSPRFKDLKLNSDYPILMNDPHAVIADGATSTVPYLMKPIILDCFMAPLTPKAGIGIALSKCFDGLIMGCDVYNFGVNILLNGSDLNVVTLNRIRSGELYNILETSALTFGSQNFVNHNDILQVGTNGVHYGSSSRHGNFQDNYCEQTNPCRGFMDLGSVELPQYGANPQSAPFSTIVKGNRLDGHSYARDFVYRTNPRGLYLEIQDVGTSGAAHADPSKELVVVGGGFPILYNTVNAVSYKISGPRFGEYDGFVTHGNFHEGKALTINSKNLTGLRGLYGNLAFNSVRVRGRVITLAADMLVNTQWSFPPVADVTNPYMSVNESYKVTVRARAVAGTDTLKFFATSNNAASGTVYTIALSNQFEDFTFTMKGIPAANTLGFSVGRATANGLIEIQEIRVEQGIHRSGALALVETRQVLAKASYQVLVPVLGAQPGEKANVGVIGNTGGFMLEAHVVSVSNVQVTFFNPTEGNLTITAGTIMVTVTK